MFSTYHKGAEGGKEEGARRMGKSVLLEKLSGGSRIVQEQWQGEPQGISGVYKWSLFLLCGEVQNILVHCLPEGGHGSAWQGSFLLHLLEWR